VNSQNPCVTAATPCSPPWTLYSISFAHSLVWDLVSSQYTVHTWPPLRSSSGDLDLFLYVLLLERILQSCWHLMAFF
jgi:hypothetical protein